MRAAYSAAKMTNEIASTVRNTSACSPVWNRGSVSMMAKPTLATMVAMMTKRVTTVTVSRVSSPSRIS